MLIDNNAQNAPTESTLVKANISVSEFKVNIALEEDTKTSKVFVSVILKNLSGTETHVSSALSLITSISTKRSAWIVPMVTTTMGIHVLLPIVQRPTHSIPFTEDVYALGTVPKNSMANVTLVKKGKCTITSPCNVKDVQVKVKLLQTIVFVFVNLVTRGFPLWPIDANVLVMFLFSMKMENAYLVMDITMQILELVKNARLDPTWSKMQLLVNANAHLNIHFFQKECVTNVLTLAISILEIPNLVNCVPMECKDWSITLVHVNQDKFM